MKWLLEILLQLANNPCGKDVNSGLLGPLPCGLPKGHAGPCKVCL